MTHSDKIKGQAEKAWANYDAHLTKAEDHLEAAARKAETSFEEHTAVPETRLARTEGYLEAAARTAELQSASSRGERATGGPPRDPPARPPSLLGLSALPMVVAEVARSTSAGGRARSRSASDFG